MYDAIVSVPRTEVKSREARASNTKVGFPSFHHVHLSHYCAFQGWYALLGAHKHVKRVNSADLVDLTTKLQ